MAENESLTPEKQLLKLIENPKQSSVRVESAKREGKKWFSFSALKGRFAFWKNASGEHWFSLNRYSKSSDGIHQINSLLVLLCVALTIGTGYQIWDMAMKAKQASNLILATHKAPSAESAEPEALQGIAYYLDKIQGRNVFNPVETEKKEEETAAVVESAAEVDSTKDYSLVGIAWSDDPEAMIEDKKGEKTLFVKRGQVLGDGVRVVTIFRDKVILSQNGKEIELR